MPQIFQVVCCYQCTTYQVKQQTKSMQWSCKLCGERQSLKKVIFEGSAKDCRENTQKLNVMKAEQNRQAVPSLSSTESTHLADTASQHQNSSTAVMGSSSTATAGASRWNKFLD